jgi:hypothetical protein
VQRLQPFKLFGVTTVTGGIYHQHNFILRQCTQIDGVG